MLKLPFSSYWNRDNRDSLKKNSKTNSADQEYINAGSTMQYHRFTYLVFHDRLGSGEGCTASAAYRCHDIHFKCVQVSFKFSMSFYDMFHFFGTMRVPSSINSWICILVKLVKVSLLVLKTVLQVTVRLAVPALDAARVKSRTWLWHVTWKVQWLFPNSDTKFLNLSISRVKFNCSWTQTVGHFFRVARPHFLACFSASAGMTVCHLPWVWLSVSQVDKVVIIASSTSTSL